MIFGKYPRAGEVKTRLVPPLTFRQAALLYEAFLLDALDRYRTLAPAVEPVLYLANEIDIPLMEEMLRGDLQMGQEEPPPDPLLQKEGGEEEGGGIAIRPQRGHSLGDRLERAFDEAFREGCPAACATGSDHPTLPVEYVRSAFDAMSDCDLAIGPADDGGYYLLGMKQLHRPLFGDLPFSTSRLFEETMYVAAGEGLRVKVLPAWYDVDDESSLRRLWQERGLLPENARTRRALEAIGRGWSAEL
jgi:glycosyltransferase A (GT-A) superfamily protein (DUF2064 family)